VYLAAAWPGEAHIRLLFVAAGIVTAVLGWLPKIVVAALQPIITTEAERLARVVVVDLAGRIQAAIADQFEAERRVVSAEDALRARLLGDRPGHASVRALRIAGERD
jgi:hypothetical protein